MSKKGKVSSGKKTKKKSVKSSVKKATKSGKAASKKKVAKKPLPNKSNKSKKTIKISKSISKNKTGKIIAKKVIHKKTVKAPVSHPKKTASTKEILVPKIKTVTISNEKVHELSKKPFYIKKDDAPIPEYKPIIKPTIKVDNSSKDGFPTTLKTTNATSFVSTPSKKADSYSIKPEKEPAGKFELEFVIKASGELLYEFLITPSGLSEWFCDDVNIRNGIYTFVWDGQLQQARLLKTVEEQLVRYQWVDKTDGSYFEFKIQKDDLTNDISLMITDFAAEKNEQESAKLLWASQIDKLLHVMGSYF